MYSIFLSLLFSLLFSINGQAQKDTILLKDAIELRFEATQSDFPFFGESLALKVYLENRTEDTIYLLTMSCYGFKHFFDFKNENIWNDSGISCTFNSITTKTLLPKELIEFQTYLYFEGGLPQEAVDIGLELTKIPKKEAKEMEVLFPVYEEIPLEKFVFWKRIKNYSLDIVLPFLRR